MGYSKGFFNLLDQVNEFSEENNFPHGVWYRGQRNDWSLKSGLFRLYDDLEMVSYKERGLYVEFLSLSQMQHNKRDFELLFLMQHHKMPTRLLDWSESFMVALFFACENWNPSLKPVLWMLSPKRLNGKARGDFDILNPAVGDERLYEKLIHKATDKDIFEHTIPIFPMRNSFRLIAQHGVFTMQGNTVLPLEEEFNGELISERIVSKIVLSPNLIVDIQKFLHQSGINYYTIFPDLDGLSTYLRTSK